MGSHSKKPKEEKLIEKVDVVSERDAPAAWSAENISRREASELPVQGSPLLASLLA